MQDEVLQGIAAAHDVTVAEVVLAWQLQQGLITIPSSTSHCTVAAALPNTRPLMPIP